ncbi:hypothetical protein PTSG_06400 [Salpingoeca rosetta]|uniref:Uncharacterized protein n=1 Tax=Salpingoeca rosetta (strain ATCC 50818 / BSB-021) TaxID=946362 RepID=F2UCT2_SALR5|nr:uncharacterized protein PTSG_06400 [Salpingoeca rosetta]EGD74389.1 hypothetical protein PTSG_06400 [Salpingoeca rosetta]|eukprot:XP_004993289.1 hypothetical protein PTSG_06400 [Salpingoeca rosetta]
MACVVCLLAGVGLHAVVLPRLRGDSAAGTSIEGSELPQEDPRRMSSQEQPEPWRPVPLHQCADTSLAVLFTFHAGKQLADAVAFLQQLQAMKPCFHTPATLIIFTETEQSKQLAVDELTEHLKADTITGCFPEVEFRSAQLTPAQDTYPKGASLQFHAALDQVQGRFDYTLLIEPDVVVLQPGWLDAMCDVVSTHARLIGDEEGPWVIGSVPRAPKVRYPRPVSHRLHLNGNAIYNTRSAVFAGVRHSVRTNAFQNTQDKGELRSYQASDTGRAYDVDFASFLFHSKHFDFVQQHYHRFIASPFIQNWWRGKWSASHILEESPQTFLVHGGTKIQS